MLIKKTKEENTAAIRHLERQIVKVDKEIEIAIKDKKDTVPENQLNSDKAVDINCKLCEKSFEKFIDLENPIQICHENHHVFECDKCEKGFILKWRLKKHMRLHAETNIKTCHYFNNNRNCPYEKRGCKFRHSVSKICELMSKCTRSLCPYRHEDIKTTRNDTNDTVEDSKMDDNENSANTSDAFVTSTPVKVFQCENCNDKTQCTDCFVRQVTAPLHRVHFEDDADE